MTSQRDSLTNPMMLMLWAALVAASTACGSSMDPDAGQPDAGPVPDAGMEPAPDAPMADSEAPRVAITFPPASALSPTGTLIVRGTATDDGVIRAIRVNGVEAESSDGFGTWTAEVPLVDGMNELVIESEDAAGNLAADAARTSVAHTVPLFRPEDMAVVGERVLVLDPRQNALVGIDRATGARKVISNAATGAGPSLESIWPRMAVDADGERVYVSTSVGIMTVDLATGDRTNVFDLNSDPGLAFVEALALDQANNRLLALIGLPATLVAIDLDSGESTILSGEQAGSGPILDDPSDMVLDAAGGRVFVLQGFSEKAILAIDPTTGERTLVSSKDRGTGPSLSSSRGLAFDAAQERILVTDSSAQDLLTIDPVSGDRAYLSEGGNPSYPLQYVVGLALSPDASQAYATLANPDELASFDIGTGERQVFSQARTGSDIWIQQGYGLALDPAGGRLLMTDAFWYTVMSIDLSDNSIALLADRYPDNDVGPSLYRISDLALDPVMNRAFGITALNQVIAVDLATDERTELLDENPENGPVLENMVQLTHDHGNGRLLTLEKNLRAVISIDLSTGARSVIADDLGVESSFPGLGDMAVDLATQQAYVLDTGGDAVLAVDLATGAHHVVADEATGIGLDLIAPRDIALDANDGRVVVFDRARGTLVAVDLASGDRVPLPSVLDLSSFSTVNALAFDSERDIAFLTEDFLGGVLLIDVQTGANVLVGR